MLKERFYSLNLRPQQTRNLMTKSKFFSALTHHQYFVTTCFLCVYENYNDFFFHGWSLIRMWFCFLVPCWIFCTWIYWNKAVLLPAQRFLKKKMAKEKRKKTAKTKTWMLWFPTLRHCSSHDKICETVRVLLKTVHTS